MNEIVKGELTNGWLKVELNEAVRYLPEFINGERVLTPQTEANVYKNTNPDGRGVAYRRSPDMNDRDNERSVQMNEIVKGELSNGWLKVELNEAQY